MYNGGICIQVYNILCCIIYFILCFIRRKSKVDISIRIERSFENAFIPIIITSKRHKIGRVSFYGQLRYRDG